ncbi:iron-sulfur cluster co-chaperone protein HscB isoform X3 [Pungitius pungitius]|uniref:iron-sulfur cluster co-chaperone protein HscB isoform X3 n=1 Tax=Pungitius pungitius TaxID=134920 RepID=UPI002E130554
MFSLRTLRTLCSRRALLPNSRLAAKRQAACTTVTRSTRCVHSSVGLEARGRERTRIDSTNTVGSSQRGYCTGQVQLRCWNCKQRLDTTPAFFCTSCNVIQPPEEGASYFKMMDCDFTFSVDTQKLQKRYLQLQRALHPDNFSQKPVLELEGMRTEEGTDPGADPAFLAELMEINEALDGALTPEDADEIGRDTKVCTKRTGTHLLLTCRETGGLDRGDRRCPSCRRASSRQSPACPNEVLRKHRRESEGKTL